MIKLVINLTKVAIAAVVAVLFSSCNMNITSLKKVDGSGNVVTKNRAISEDFTSVSASNGLEIILEQSNDSKVHVEADDNLQDHIKTEVKEGELKIYSDVNIRNSKAKKVYVQMPNLNSLETSSGASVTSSNTLESTSMDISASSGSAIDIKINAATVNCDSSSGSEIKLAGKADKLETESSSGSAIDASGLAVKNAVADSSSGSSINLNASENITAEASSGSTVNYVSKPATLNKKTSSGGSVNED
nr:head GIN domain-containing protein [uncultured Flavobacterium sp.]